MSLKLGHNGQLNLLIFSITKQITDRSHKQANPGNNGEVNSSPGKKVQTDDRLCLLSTSLMTRWGILFYYFVQKLPNPIDRYLQNLHLAY